MRVIAGIYKGKKLDGFDILGTRPTMDRVKESMIASIQNYIPDATVLDLFAGSGSIGIEMLSNGAKSCYFCDNNQIAINTINKNTLNMNEDIHIIKKDYQLALKEFKDKNKFDIIFLDPPYDLYLINDCLNKIYEYNLLTEKGIIVIEYETEKIITKNYEILKEKQYGNKFIMILKKINENKM